MTAKSPIISAQAPMMSPKTRNPANIFSRIGTTFAEDRDRLGDDRFGPGVGVGAGPRPRLRRRWTAR